MPVSDSDEECDIDNIGLLVAIWISLISVLMKIRAEIQILTATTSCWFSLNLAKGYPAWKY